jgi:hypothetical protein
MSFINWGSEGPEQLAARKRMEDEILFEQVAAYSAAVSAAAAAASAGSGGKPKPSEFVGQVDWLVVAPEGFDPETDDYEDFDTWETDTFTPLLGVKRLVIEAESAYAHTHEYPSTELTIQLFNSVTSTWITVWSYELVNLNYPDDGSDDYFVDGIDVTFPEVASVTKIRLTSDPAVGQTYHDWGSDSTLFKFYK